MIYELLPYGQADRLAGRGGSVSLILFIFEFTTELINRVSYTERLTQKPGNSLHSKNLVSQKVYSDLLSSTRHVSYNYSAAIHLYQSCSDMVI